MRTCSHRHDRSRRIPELASMPYSECRSASISGHWARIWCQVRPERPPVCDRACRGVGSPPSYHS